MLPPRLKNLNLDIQESVPLAPFTTFQIGGISPGVITCRLTGEVLDVIKILREEGMPYIFIGGGSNLLISDKGIDCFVVRYVSPSSQMELNGCEIKVAASALLDDLARFAAERGLTGINYCSGIPGTVGGAVVGNAGAFGKQISDVLVSATLLDRQGNLKEITKDELGFQYRDCILKKTQDIVLSVKFRLSAGDKHLVLNERKEILQLRQAKHPDYKEHPCAGSFFRNIEKTSNAGRRQAAGWFLDKAGAKALKVGGAGVYEKHANIIINENNAKAQDVFDLAQQMVALVKREFDIDLTREVLCVGTFEGRENPDSSIIW